MFSTRKGLGSDIWKNKFETLRYLKEHLQVKVRHLPNFSVFDSNKKREYNFKNVLERHLPLQNKQSSLKSQDILAKGQITGAGLGPKVILILGSQQNDLGSWHLILGDCLAPCNVSLAEAVILAIMLAIIIKTRLIYHPALAIEWVNNDLC